MALQRRKISAIEVCVSPHDGLITKTYDEQDEVEEQMLDIYRNFQKKNSDSDQNVPILYREKHGAFLRKGLNKLSDAYEALDASRPWLCYWILHSMNLLELKLTPEEIKNISAFLNNCQDPNGGFGGGPSQLPHLAATYAAINALVSLASPEALAVINRELLLDFILSMKNKDGSFRMHRGGEVDVRAVYCAVVVGKLTNLQSLSPNLFDNTADWIKRCQSYEGGFGASPGMEAHGGYTYCAVAALVLLEKQELLNVKLVLNWLTFRQLPIEGGFQGRTNKLVDGCYAFWQGACFPLLKKPFYNLTALQEYLLICCQHPYGGLIDKPGKQRDYYHTCYTLSGLSSSQNFDQNKSVLGSPTNILKPIHPTFNLTLDSVKAAQKFYYDTAPEPETSSK